MNRKAIFFHNVTVLGAEGPLGASLRIAGSRISAIDAIPEKSDVLIDCGGGLLIPGLINAHDHLELNHFKRLKYRERYTHSLQWFEDIESRFETDPDLINPRSEPLEDRLWIGLIKNLLSGVTTVCHHNPYYRELECNIPVRVVKEYGFGHSLFRGNDPAVSYQNTPADEPWIIHLAEGVDQNAGEEFEKLESIGALGQNTVLVHGIGLNEKQRQKLIEYGGGLVWCPGSNDFLFGRTADVKALSQAGKLALGSDSRLTGEFDLLTELKVAAACRQLTGQSLFRTVTVDSARILRLRQGGMGKIIPGGSADLVLLPGPLHDDLFSALIGLERSQLELIVRDGNPVVGSTRMKSVFNAANIRFAPVVVDGIEKIMDRNVATRLIHSRVKEPGLTIEGEARQEKAESNHHGFLA